MDQPDLDPRQHDQALDGLSRINRLSLSARILWQALAPLTRRIPGRPLRVLDLATGAGDVPLALERIARRKGASLTLEACDQSPTALAYAEKRAAAWGGTVRFFRYDALTMPCPEGYDAIVCSLFLHHLTEVQAVTLLTAMRQAAGHLVAVNDLERCRAGWGLAWIGTRLLTRSPVVHVDGLRSVEGAFTHRELAELARQAGMESCRLARHWPFRQSLVWLRP